MKLYNITNHRLTEQQITAAKEELGVTEVVSMPDEVAAAWGQIPAEADLEAMLEHLKPVAQFLRYTKSEDYILLQGENTAVYQIASLHPDGAVKAKPIVSTTKRVSQEVDNGDGTVTKKLIFEHVRFRKYFIV